MATTGNVAYVWTGSQWVPLVVGSYPSQMPPQVDGGVFDSTAPYDGGDPTTTSWYQTFDGGIQ